MPAQTPPPHPPPRHLPPSPLPSPPRFLWPLLLLLLLTPPPRSEVEGHGRLIDPPSRASMWRYGFDSPADYDDHQGYCGGKTQLWGRFEGRCGVCGDPWSPRPRAHERGGRYYDGTPVRVYRQGDVINVAMAITANHRGWVEVRLCPYDAPAPEDVELDEEGQLVEVSQACLDKHLLQLADGSGPRFFLPEPYQVGEYSVDLELPADVSCDQCLLQWKWNVANSWGTDEDGNSCIGCGEQEQFYACADVVIEASGRRTQDEDNPPSYPDYPDYYPQYPELTFPPPVVTFPRPAVTSPPPVVTSPPSRVTSPAAVTFPPAVTSRLPAVTSPLPVVPRAPNPVPDLTFPPRKMTFFPWVVTRSPPEVTHHPPPETLPPSTALPPGPSHAPTFRFLPTVAEGDTTWATATTTRPTTIFVSTTGTRPVSTPGASGTPPDLSFWKWLLRRSHSHRIPDTPLVAGRSTPKSATSTPGGFRGLRGGSTTQSWWRKLSHKSRSRLWAWPRSRAAGLLLRGPAWDRGMSPGVITSTSAASTTTLPPTTTSDLTAWRSREDSGSGSDNGDNAELSKEPQISQILSLADRLKHLTLGLRRTGTQGQLSAFTSRTKTTESGSDHGPRRSAGEELSRSSEGVSGWLQTAQRRGPQFLFHVWQKTQRDEERKTAPVLADVDDGDVRDRYLPPPPSSSQDLTHVGSSAKLAPLRDGRLAYPKRKSANAIAAASSRDQPRSDLARPSAHTQKPSAANEKAGDASRDVPPTADHGKDVSLTADTREEGTQRKEAGDGGQREASSLSSEPNQTGDGQGEASSLPSEPNQAGDGGQGEASSLPSEPNQAGDGQGEASSLSSEPNQAGDGQGEASSLPSGNPTDTAVSPVGPQTRVCTPRRRWMLLVRMWSWCQFHCERGTCLYLYCTCQ